MATATTIFNKRSKRGGQGRTTAGTTSSSLAYGLRLSLFFYLCLCLLPHSFSLLAFVCWVFFFAPLFFSATGSRFAVAATDNYDGNTVW